MSGLGEADRICAWRGDVERADEEGDVERADEVERAGG